MAQRSVCTLCEGSQYAAMLGDCQPQSEISQFQKTDVDMLFSGSPCDPFSQQRCKRFRDDSVKAHGQFKVSMKEVIDLYKLHEPRKMVFEQVMGFQMPFEKGGKTTPKDMYLVSLLLCFVLECF